ncbi:hypothetical protein V5F40_21545 [Xanthobacter sp. DSM 14520]
MARRRSRNAFTIYSRFNIGLALVTIAVSTVLLLAELIRGTVA